MANEKNFFTRTFDAMVASRERTAKRYVEQFERDYGDRKDKFTKR